MAKQISADMDIGDVSREVPKAIDALTRRGIICIQCGTPLWKTVKQAIVDSGENEFQKVINEVNAEITNL